MKSSRRKSMRTIKEIMRLHHECGLGVRAIGRACKVSPTTVSGYLDLSRDAGLDYESIKELDDEELQCQLSPERSAIEPRKTLPDLVAIPTELKKKGVTLQLLWEEYRVVNPNGYGRSQFFEIYKQHAKTLHPVMRFTHKGGDKLFLDFSGDRPHYVDQETGEIIYTELFVAVLGASSHTFAVAVANQQIPNWIKAHILAFEYFGGVTNCLVPDNLKSAVTLACKYDPVLNPTYAEMAAHYQVAVIPARPNKPRDKGKVESGVLCAQRRILAALRNRTFFSLREVNAAIAEELEKLASRTMQGYGKSRRELFVEIDQPALRPLPASRFEIREWKKAKVGIDYHIGAQGAFYSVPYTLIGKEVEVCSTGSVVEIFHNSARVASHPRSYKKGEFITIDAHRPHAHQKHLEWTPARIKHWGESIGPSTGIMSEAIMAAGLQPEHGYRKCLGLLRLAKQHTPERLEIACQKALHLGVIGYRSVKSLLDNHLERLETTEQAQEDPPIVHVNIRGGDYYSDATGGPQ
jgi:transposase